ncbi:MAG: HDOD domain-containing protein [Candidatus Eisenbacteria bacterium]|nr:HDOD domain-containing protein [Candidatus Eisenbacteria bacterium]
MHPTQPVLELPLQLTRDLPAMPVVATRLFEMAEHPDTDAMDIARVLSMDPALTAKVLKTANSSYYAPTEPITNVLQAVTRLGFRALRNLVLVEALPFRGRGSEAVAPLQQGLWEHAVATALGARLLMRRRGGAHPDDAFVAGLLHDVGKTALARFKGEDYADLVAEVREEHRSFADAERGRYGFDHADAGASVLRHWKLPALLVDGVQHHHRAGAGPNPAMWAAVELAGRASKGLGLGLEPLPELEIEACEAGKLLQFGAPDSAWLSTELKTAFEAEKSQFQL